MRPTRPLRVVLLAVGFVVVLFAVSYCVVGVSGGEESMAPPTPGEGPGHGSPDARYAVVPVYYGTDRRPVATPGDRAAFENARGDGRLHLGRAEVSIPSDHKLGNIEKPKWWKLEFREKPEKHVTILGIEVLDQATFFARLGENVSRKAEKQALVFIHGYNVAFDAALERTAQVSYDLHFDGATILYSWPSKARPAGYTVDEASIEWSIPHLKTFLALVLTQAGADVVHVVAHSMGNRALVRAVTEMDFTALPERSARLRQVVFAAPDVDADTFRQFARDFHGRASRFTLYASSKDKALAASKAVHGAPRAGDSGSGLVVVDSVDTIDASEISTGFLGHSYIGDNRSILSDLYYLLDQGLPPSRRANLRPKNNSDGRYWFFQP